MKERFKKIPCLTWIARSVSLLLRRRSLASLINSLRPVLSDASLVRFGPTGDGGYLLPNDLEGISACFSPGVCDTSGFEMDCAKLGIPVYMADASVDRPALENPLFHFSKKFIGANNNDSFIRLDDWIEQSVGNNGKDLILQMDIEGYEYEVLNSVTDQFLERFRIMVIEFHGLHGLLNGAREPFASIQATFRKILRTHRCVHIHPNNTAGVRTALGIDVPDLLEMTFLRKDRGFQSQNVTRFPHPLDSDNDAFVPTVTLPRVWYGE